MIVSKIYETKEGDLTAIVYEDGKCINFIYEPELVAMEDGLIGDAQCGFPDALSYEFDIAEGYTLEEMVNLQEEESKLIAEIGEQIVIYPQRMGAYAQEIFEVEIGEDLWNEALQKANDDKGIQINI